MPHAAALSRACLNGWWDFCPADSLTGAEVPTLGWEVGALLVPSVWTKSPHGWRKKGDQAWLPAIGGEVPINEYDEANEYLFDIWRYPTRWSNVRRAWLRRTLEVSVKPAGRRLWLRISAAMPRGTLVCNGTVVGSNVHPALPAEYDVTDLLQVGTNVIALLIENYERDARGRPMVPNGNHHLTEHRGIWQDVWLVERGSVAVAAVDIRTSVTKGELAIEWELRNDGDRPVTVALDADVCAWATVPWHQAWKVQDGAALLGLRTIRVTVPAHGTASASVVQAWADAPRWSPRDPRLLQLRTTLCTGDHVHEVHGERFGFREIRIDGHDLLLNGEPIHIASDWGHKESMLCQTEGWIRAWFRMLRRANMNHSRLHTHPHAEMVLLLADEEGILITSENGLHGSGGSQAVESDVYWERAREHVVRHIRRDRNHPCVILWSVCNEMRWNNPGCERSQRELPPLRELMLQLDPTRPSYYEGDTTLWDERTQQIANRHYGKVCSGAGWWDRKQPLLSGEMSMHHLMGPNNTLHVLGDVVFTDYTQVDRAAGLDARWIIEDGRALGVAGFGPWNLSTLVNARGPAEVVRLEWEDWTTPGVKPRWVPPFTNEFCWWDEGAEFIPTPSFAEQAAAFRPLAIIDSSRRSQYWAGTPIERQLVVVNDTGAVVSGTLHISLRDPVGAVISTKKVSVTIAVGRRQSVSVRLVVPATVSGYCTYAVELATDAGRDQWERALRIAAPDRRLAGKGTIAVMGDGGLLAVLGQLGVTVRPVSHAAQAKGCKVMIISPFLVQPGSTINREIAAFCAGGGRVVVLEQATSPFAGVPLQELAVQTVWRRSPHHVLLTGLADDDLAYWGETAYSDSSVGAAVARRGYRKDDGSRIEVLIDSGEGQFGTGDLEQAHLISVREGTGVVLACQLRLAEMQAVIPTARELLCRLLEHAAAWRAPKELPLIELSGACSPARLRAACTQAKAGATLIVRNAPAATLATLGKILDLALTTTGRPGWQAARAIEHPLLAGVSNHDLCGVEQWTYADWSDPKPDNRVVVPEPLAPAVGLEALLTVPRQAINEEMFVQGLKIEPLRAYAATVFGFTAGEPGVEIALGRVRHGKGQILIDRCVFPTDQDKPRLRYARLAHALLRNLGHDAVGGLLSAKQVEVPANSGPGFPTVAMATTEAIPWSAAVDGTTLAVDGFMAMAGVLNRAPFTAVKAVDSAWPASIAAGGSVFLYLVLSSPTVRLNLANDFGCPNPEALTFLDGFGAGQLAVAVDGRDFGSQTLIPGRAATFPDIPLAQGRNHVLLRWTPAGDTPLQLRFRTILDRTETGFAFGT